MLLPSNDAELSESLHQFVTVWKLLGKEFPHADQTDRPGLAISWASASFSVPTNVVFLNEPRKQSPKCSKAKRKEASNYLQAKSHGGLFVIFPGLSKGVRQGKSFTGILAEAKLLAAIPATGMAGNIFPLEAKGHPNLRFVRIEDDATIQTFAELNCAAYNLPMETAVSGGEGSIAVGKTTPMDI